jgi:hypothetical protein
VAPLVSNLGEFCRNQLGGQGGRPYPQTAHPSAQTAGSQAYSVYDKD